MLTEADKLIVAEARENVGGMSPLGVGLLSIIERQGKALAEAVYYMEVIAKQPGEGAAKRLNIAGKDKIKSIMEGK